MRETEFRIPLKSGLSLFAREVLYYNHSRPDSIIPNNDNVMDDDQQNLRDDNIINDENKNKEKKELISRRRRAFLVIVVHGGPGLNDHQETFPGLRRLLERRSSTTSQRRCNSISVDAMIFYDQLGCGKSDEPTPSMLDTDNNKYSLKDYYVKELEEVILFTASRYPEYKDNICVLGHSWGGQLVLEYVIGKKQPEEEEEEIIKANTEKGEEGIICAVAAMMISNAPLDETNYERKQCEMRNALDDETRSFYEQMDQEILLASDANIGSRIFRKLIGCSETNITGEMKHWSLLTTSSSSLDVLRHSKIPCLFLAGDQDTIPVQDYQQLRETLFVTNSISDHHHHHRVEIIKGGTHGPFYGPTADTYFGLIDSFLEGLLL